MTTAVLDGRVVIVGAGVAGLATALFLAPRPVVLLSKAPLGAGSSTIRAQGGLAAAFGEDDDPAFHAADTLVAGDGLCDARVVERFARAAPAAIEKLVAWGARFDRDPRLRYALGLEAAHSRHRIVHAQGDGTGREVIRSLAAAARATPSIEICEGYEARRVLLEDGRVCGILASDAAHDLIIATHAVVLATGGVGALYEVSTNPLGSYGQGLALAANAGARMADLEFVQFHPTALDVPGRPAPLISEAVRGEGALLVDDRGERFMADTPGGELAARDVVARAIFRRRKAGRRVFLDARGALGPRFSDRFPNIAAVCARHRIDPARDLIPVRTAQHYHMGGIAVDGAGRSSIDGLWACGEVSCTGLHGANRLASNSLTEAVVFARWTAESVAGAAAPPSWRLLGASGGRASEVATVRTILSAACDVERNAEGLSDAVRSLVHLVEGGGTSKETAAVALMICVSALLREESRGAHTRSDFPVAEPNPGRRSLTLAEAVDLAGALPSLSIRRARSA